MKKFGLIILVLVLALTALLAQRRGRGRFGGGYGGGWCAADGYRTPREMTQHSVDTPMWTNAPGFEN